MKSTLIAAFLLVVAASTGAPTDELVFRGEIVEVDVEASLLVVQGRKGGEQIDRLFEVNELTTEIRDRVPSDIPAGDALDETEPIALSDLEVGDYVEIRYEVMKGRNVATRIERNRAHHA